MTRTGHARWTLAFAAASAALTIFAAKAAPRPDPVSLGVKGRSNSTPWVAASGSFVAVAWGASADGKTDVFVAVSRDSGQTFASPVQVNTVAGEARLGGELPPRIALTPKKGSDPEVAVLWTARGEATTLKSARSRDGGRTFEPPVTFQSAGTAGDRGWPSLAVDGRGTPHAIWLDHRGLAADRAAGKPRHSHGGAGDGLAMAQKSALYYSSPGTGQPTERELLKGVCYCCKTALAIGPDGSLFAAWRQVYEGNVRDIAFVVSRDGGKSFSAPVRASEDGWSIPGCPDDGPAMAVDARGTVHLVWPTVIGGDNPQGEIFYASTRDGRTFTKRLRVPTLGSPRPMHPQIAIDGGGRILVGWDEVIDGRRVASVRELKLGALKPNFGELVSLAGSGASTYPVLAATDKGFVAVWTTGGDASRVEAKTLNP